MSEPVFERVLAAAQPLVEKVLTKIAARPAARSARPSPGGGTFASRSFANAAGERQYKIYVPSGYRGGAVPLVIMLHGCTQSPDDFALGTRMNVLAEARTFIVAYPAQSSSANAGKCWNWFKPGDQQRDAGEPSILAGITRQIMGEYAIDPRRVFVAGLSAGGAAAAVLGAAYPELYAAIGVHSGIPLGAARDIPSAFAAMRQGDRGVARPMLDKPTIVFHGDGDTTVNPKNGATLVAQTLRSGLRAATEAGGRPGGHAYSRTTYADPAGAVRAESWVIHGAGHAWSGGNRAGSYTDPLGPDASAEMLRFFFSNALPAAGAKSVVGSV